VTDQILPRAGWVTDDAGSGATGAHSPVICSYRHLGSGWSVAWGAAGGWIGLDEAGQALGALVSKIGGRVRPFDRVVDAQVAIEQAHAALMAKAAADGRPEDFTSRWWDGVLKGEPWPVTEPKLRVRAIGTERHKLRGREIVARERIASAHERLAAAAEAVAGQSKVERRPAGWTWVSDDGWTVRGGQGEDWTVLTPNGEPWTDTAAADPDWSDDVEQGGCIMWWKTSIGARAAVDRATKHDPSLAVGWRLAP